MAKKLALGIDVGATKIRGVVFDGKKILKRREYKYPRRPSRPKEFWQALFVVIDTLLLGIPKKNLVGISLGMPAPIVEGRRAWRPGNLLVIDRLNLRTPLAQRYHTKIFITNDTKAAAYAEWLHGAGEKSASMFMLTLGSGVGGGFIKNGKIQTGAFDTAFEAGRMIIEATKSLRIERGVEFEDVASEKFFLRRGIQPREAEQKARMGNQKMKKLWRRFGEYVGVGLANIAFLIEPEVIAIGGGIAHAWPLFAPTMRKTMQHFLRSFRAAQKTKLRRAKFGDDAGAMGAALIILKL